jgi:hypothetical protein
MRGELKLRARALAARSKGAFELPNWDPTSRKKVRNALLVL